MGRFTIHATIAVDVNGKDEVEAYEYFVDAINGAADHGDGIRDITVQHSETKVVPFIVPPGAERWATAAEGIRLDEDCDRKIAAMHDGSWWWSDGHVALRCDGPVPADYREIPDGELSKSFPKKPVVTAWGAARESRKDSRIQVCVAEQASAVAIQSKYRSLVEASVPGVTWKVGKTLANPALAFDGDALVAVVMPCKYDEAAPHKGAAK